MNAKVIGMRWNDETHVLVGQGYKTWFNDTSFVPCILKEQRKATLSLFQCPINPCNLLKLELICTITVSSVLHCFRYDKEISDCTCHIHLLFWSVLEFSLYTRGPCRTHTVGPHAYGLANLTLLTHTPYGKVRTCGQWRLWSYCAVAQTDLSLRWAHRSFCWFCRAAA